MNDEDFAFEEIVKLDKDSLSPIEIDEAEGVFRALDNDNNGFIEPQDIKAAMDLLKIKLSEENWEELKNGINSQEDTRIDLEYFLDLFQKYKRLSIKAEDDVPLMVFISMGGNPDKSGSISADKLRSIIKEEFQMTIDIEKLLKEIDTDGSGSIEYEELKGLLESA
eukprot:TRINITY_DN13029_c0_g2_i4.p2 TRINITY_DN13029_c0_g2~~TRINITY_DN13029_c0_g2_i4.p2  ORF type:complete len:166 (+),score=55.70 TRINITY_DN13029_c0_g2_i4:140-637(+)